MSAVPNYHSGPDDDTHASPQPQLRWAPIDRRKAVVAGAEVLELFARPDVEPTRWWRQLAPRLTPLARSDYQAVDPSNIEDTVVHSERARLVDLDTPTAAIVHIPTDAGVYAVTLARTRAAPRWLVDRIAPPEPFGD